MKTFIYLNKKYLKKIVRAYLFIYKLNNGTKTKLHNNYLIVDIE
jgi:hypothetical protein